MWLYIFKCVCVWHFRGRFFIALILRANLKRLNLAFGPFVAKSIIGCYAGGKNCGCQSNAQLSNENLIWYLNLLLFDTSHIFTCFLFQFASRVLLLLVLTLIWQLVLYGRPFPSPVMIETREIGKCIGLAHAHLCAWALIWHCRAHFISDKFAGVTYVCIIYREIVIYY